MSLPDVEGALRTWLRGRTAITALVGQRVFFGVPKKADTWPLITLTRVGGGDDQSQAPVDRALIQIDCWGDLDTSGNGKKADATTLVNTVRAELQAVDRRTALSADVDALGINVETVVYLPDPDNARPRYVVTAEVTAVSS